MAKPNTSGLPDTGDYALGRGVIYMAELGDDGLPDENGWLDLGNAPQINLAVEEEVLEHKSSRGGTATIDKQVTLSKKVTVSFQLDEINQKTVEMFFSGESDTFVNPAVAGEAEQNMKFTNVMLGRWYDFTDTDGTTRIMGVDSADVTVEKDAMSDVTLDEGIDYKLDTKWGRIFFFEDAVKVAAGDEVNLTIAADAMAPSPINRTKALQSTTRLVALKIIGVNPANNDEETEWEIHQTQLKADGELALIGDEFMVAGFTGVLEANNQGYPDSPYMTIHTTSES